MPAVRAPPAPFPETPRVTKTDPKADPKPAPVTLASIAEAEQAEKQAGEDAYTRLVADLAADTAALTPAGVIGVLRRAGRTSDELAEDVTHLKRLAPVEAAFARLDDLRAEEAGAKARLEAAVAEWERKKADIDKPAAAAEAEHAAARAAVHNCQLLQLQITELHRLKAQRDARRQRAGAADRGREVEG
jgi:hypothetical protein